MWSSWVYTSTAGWRSAMKAINIDSISWTIDVNSFVAAPLGYCSVVLALCAMDQYQ